MMLWDTCEMMSPEYRNGQSHGVGRQTGGGAAQSPVKPLQQPGKHGAPHPNSTDFRFNFFCPFLK